jgi:anti-sigma-K factor RskA
MTELETGDFNGLAAEYVLGTLDAAEKRNAEALLHSDAGFAAEVEAWRRRLDPLLEVPSAEPPAGVLDRVFSAIEGRGLADGAEIIELRRRAVVWKRTAGAAVAIAAGLVLYVAAQPIPPAAPAYFAVLESADRKQAFVAAADPNRGGLYIQRVGGAPPPGRSYELWAIRPGTAPESLGVVGNRAQISALTLNTKTGGEALSKVLLAITEEPEGGSPDGKPSAAPIFTGPLIHAPSS